MTTRIMYIELKSGYSDDGPAWIGWVEFSKSGKTIYFNNQSFKSIGGTGISGNYRDLLSGDEYWISGVKKDGTDRHWYGGGKIMVQREAVPDYLDIIQKATLDPKQYEIVSIQKTDKQEFTEIENETVEYEPDTSRLRFKEIHKLTEEELSFMIEETGYDIQTARYNKARRSIQRYHKELLAEKEQRLLDK